MDLETLGRILLYLGGLFVLVGILFFLGSKLGLGKLPGDIYIERENISFYFPLASAIIISLILTLVLNFLIRR